MPFFGDVTGDGTLGTKDLSAMLSHVNDNKTLTTQQVTRADMNGDGIVDDDDLNYMNNYLAETDSETYYFDESEISGQFKFYVKKTPLTQGPYLLAQLMGQSFINNDGSFTKLDITTTEDGGNTIVSVDFTYDTTKSAKSNDGVSLENTDYEILSWGGIPLSRNWSVFNTTYSGKGIFENFSGKIYTSDKPTILKNTTFKNQLPARHT